MHVDPGVGGEPVADLRRACGWRSCPSPGAARGRGRRGRRGCRKTRNSWWRCRGLAQPGDLRRWRSPARRTGSWCRGGRSRGCAARSCPGCIGSVFWVRSSAWIWDFSSTHSTTAFSGGCQVQPDHVGDLGDQLGVGGELERLGPPRLDPVVAPGPQHRRVRRSAAASASSRDDQCVTPSLVGGGVNVAATIVARSTVRGRPGPLLVDQPVDPALGVALPPRDHRRPGHPDPLGDLGVRHPVRRQQHDPGPLRRPAGAVEDRVRRSRSAWSPGRSGNRSAGLFDTPHCPTKPYSYFSDTPLEPSSGHHRGASVSSAGRAFAVSTSAARSAGPVVAMSNGPRADRPGRGFVRPARVHPSPGRGAPGPTEEPATGSRRDPDGGAERAPCRRVKLVG